MYIPSYYKEENMKTIREIISSNGFAIVINTLNDRPWATHIPLMFSKNNEGKEVLIGHLSKANKQWKSFSENDEVLVIFNGAHTYISSSWYDHENVPTWNYQAVHIYGKVKLLDDKEVINMLGSLVDKYEQGQENPVSVSTMSEGFVETEARGLVGIEIEINEIQAVSKMSQNRDEKNYQRIVTKLENQGNPYANEVAGVMKKIRK